jgi:cysteine-rich repeat protein
MPRVLPSVVIAAAFLAFAAAPAHAAVPQLVAVQGALSNNAGGAAPDGGYDAVFRLYDAEFNGKELWVEGTQPVVVKGGLFSHLLGDKKPLDPKLFAQANEVWFGMQIQGEPELPRRRLLAVPLALRTALAEGLDCSGCVKLAHLDPGLLAPFVKTTDLAKVAVSGKFEDLQGGPDLSGYAKSADLSAYAKFADLSDVAKSGAYGDLEGAPALAKVGASCGTGLVMKGIKADGSYECVQGGIDPSNLPSDGLDEISGGLLTNQFQEVAASAKTPLPIPDNVPDGISDTITVPDFGTAQALTVAFELTNSDVSKVAVHLVDPAGGKHVLYQGAATGKALKLALPAPDKAVSGDLAAWIGKNPKGPWKLTVIDTGYKDNKLDGEVVAWSVVVKVQSNQKVGVNGGLKLLNAKAPPYPCTASVAGSIYFDTATKDLRYCDGGEWRNLAGTCGNGILDPTEECDDGNNANGDGCSSQCIKALGFNKNKPGLSCLNILDAGKVSGDPTKDGNYWIKAPKGQVLEVWCDMSSEGGGYTYFPVDSGKDTYRSTDDNTCKDYGLDIFYPRSKAQWTAVLAKYGSSYFATIPGVTKPGDGGNYTGCVMRSPAHYGSGCDDWRVPDNGRWWLRDSTYSEPNGDYQANCWLSMYNFDPNNIQYNDGTCNYHTTKYLCSTNDKK